MIWIPDNESGVIRPKKDTENLVFSTNDVFFPGTVAVISVMHVFVTILPIQMGSTCNSRSHQE
jgi:hypothetical protein